MIIVSDAGPLIALARINKLNLLQDLFKKVKIPPAIFSELSTSASRPGAKVLAEAINALKWIEISEKVNVPRVLLNALDRGEAEAIALARAENVLLLIDERKGRRFALRENVKITGTGAILVAAKKKGLIDRVSQVIDALTNSGYRISPSLRKKFLELADETN